MKLVFYSSTNKELYIVKGHLTKNVLKTGA